jgi:hypothetical protein
LKTALPPIVKGIQHLWPTHLHVTLARSAALIPDAKRSSSNPETPRRSFGILEHSPPGRSAKKASPFGRVLTESGINHQEVRSMDWNKAWRLLSSAAPINP